MENSDKPTHYPRIIPKPIAIDKMSKGYLKNQIEYIEHTGVKEEYLDVLKEQLKEKNKKIFKWEP